MFLLGGCLAAKGALDNDIKASDRAMKKLRGAERSKMKAHIKQQKGNKKTEENAGTSLAPSPSSPPPVKIQYR